MEVEYRSLLRLLEGPITRFAVPDYQRNYDWKEEQCRQLFDDLEALISSDSKSHLSSDSKSHFFGSIVWQPNGSNRVLVDGQQRITTTFLLLLALVKQIRSDKIKSNNSTLANTIEEKYLLDEDNKDDCKLKLKLTKGDRVAFEAVYQDRISPQMEESNIIKNYRYICEYIAQLSYSADQLFDAIKKLKVIKIELENNDDAQRIFESLNSTGLPLTPGDEIRNYILMNLNPEEEQRYYNDYWSIIENNVISKESDTNVSDFIRDWLTAVTPYTPNLDRVYADFKSYVKKNHIEIKDLLEELRRFSKYYKAIITANTDNKEVNDVLRRLNLLHITVIYPYLLNLFEYRYHNKKIDDQQMISCLESIETYLFRRWVCDLNTTGLNKVFRSLHKDAEAGIDSDIDYAEAVKGVLLAKKGSSHFPDDDEFIVGFDKREFYPISKMKAYLFSRLEKDDNSEGRDDIVQKLNGNNGCSIEHIMPQKLTPEWQKDLGENAETIHERWLNKMANLTLTDYNSKYSNHRFIDKLNTPDGKGFSSSHYHLNEYIKTQSEWGEEQLIERDKQMKNAFLKLWPMIESDFKPKDFDYEEYTLAEDPNFFTGKKIAAYKFWDEIYYVETWQEMFIDVLRQIYEQDEDMLLRLAEDDSSPIAHCLTTTANSKSTKIGDGVYYDSNTSTRKKLSMLKDVFKEAGIDYSELVFELFD